MLISFTQNQPRICKQVLATGSDDLISAYARNEQIHSNSVEISQARAGCTRQSVHWVKLGSDIIQLLLECSVVCQELLHLNMLPRVDLQDQFGWK